MTQATVAALHYYPVKSLTAQNLRSVALVAGQGLPDDRRFAILHGASQFDAMEPTWKAKTNFLALVRDERLATLHATYGQESCLLVLHRAGKPVARGQIDTAMGRMLIDQFLGAYMQGALAPPPYKLVEAPGHAFTDIPDRAVSLINLSSVKDLERVTQSPVDPLRFRGNLHVAGLAPWVEMQWVGKQIRIGGVRMEVFKTITRCAATEVNPQTAERDMAVLKSLKTGFDHVQCGVYARIIQGGHIGIGDTLTLV